MRKTCDHDKDQALLDPPGGSWGIAQKVVVVGDNKVRAVGQKSIVCRECGRFFGRIVEAAAGARARSPRGKTE
ncbi:MAG TPA: hypothetical protein VG826_29115 [Pirellulales bacterium]|nr:hypothetical protein [Pirellulales bacterium]